MKKVLSLMVLFLAILVCATGCGSKKEEVSIKPSEVLSKVYEGIKKDDMPQLMETEINEENVETFLGTKDIKFKEGIASEPMMMPIAWSVVALTLEDGVNVEQAKSLIKEKVNPRKWICVDAELITVENKGNTILLVMMDELNEDIYKTVVDNFKNLK